MLAWNDWYHVMGHTYGTWLPGDPKGFRTRHHREHVEGDYKNPPTKGVYEGLHESAKRAMKRDPVFLDPVQRRRALDELVASLHRRDFEIEVFSVDRIHLHGLVCVPDQDPKRWIGLAKKESSHYCNETGHAPLGGIWATGSSASRLKTRVTSDPRGNTSWTTSSAAWSTSTKLNPEWSSSTPPPCASTDRSLPQSPPELAPRDRGRMSECHPPKMS